MIRYPGVLRRGTIAALVTLAAILVPQRPVLADAPPGVALLTERAAALEGEIATLLQRRPDASPEQGPLLDVQTDLRLIARWFLTRAAEAPPGSDLQASAYLRARNVLALLRAFTLQGERGDRRGDDDGDDGDDERPIAPLTPAQRDAVKWVHDATYRLDPIKTVGEMDRLCADLALRLATFAALGSDPAGAPRGELPVMRPVTIEVPESDGADDGPRDAAALTLSELSKRAGGLTVSPPLRRQLGALAAAASRAAEDPARQDEAGQLFQMLAESVSLSEGLQNNTAVEPRDRIRLEEQLAEGLALFVDVRTRPAGRARVESLGRYRDMLARVRKLRLPGDLTSPLAPAFVWARQNAQQGPAVLQSIETYLELCARFDARDEPAAAVPPNHAKLVAAMEEKFSLRRKAFVDDAANLGGRGLAAVRPANLQNHADAMRQALTGIETIEHLPDVLKRLAAYKPKPFGALDKRAAASVVAMASAIVPDEKSDGPAVPANGPLTPAAATTFLTDLLRLSDFAADLEKPTAAGVPDNVIRRYTGNRLEAFDAKRREMIQGLVDAAAGGQVLDPTRLQRLDSGRALVDTLRQAREVESAAREAEVLNRWADWAMEPAQLNAVLDGYRDACASAFRGFAAGQPGPVDQWPTVRQRYAPITALLIRNAGYAQQCADFPTGVAGDLARLATPFDAQPFAAERFASFAVAAWAHAAVNGDGKGLTAIAEALAAKLGG